MSSSIVYIGLKAHVVAIEKATGAKLWSTKLKSGLSSGSSFVTLLVDGPRIYAHTHGELSCLDASTGQLLWTNELDGLGYDLASIVIEGASSPSPESVAFRKQAQARAASGASAAT